MLHFLLKPASMKKIFYIVTAFLLVILLNNCQKESADIGGGNIGGATGKGGSMAKFTIANDHLYLINEKQLLVYDINNATNPVEVNKLDVDFGIETVFSLSDKLFIGSINGVYIYDISDPENILYLSHYEHITSCDPVVANDTLAFVTLNSQSACRWQTGDNRLDILDIKNIVYPQLLTSKQMENPKGLGVDGQYLFVCNGDQGVKIFDISNIYQLEQVSGIAGIDAYDVILNNNILILVGKDGLFQYNYENIDQLELLSNILF
ncbi:MAG: hypothetical protein DRI88_08255 [Bacteroidetes bacterium]|nr:MAG: hypothetical protein DRI88_08255 [Bacteroidota bacterium]RLD85508.1 MAG: hypothetical protein DRJ02_10295 [Bacteroidota bacterium]